MVWMILDASTSILSAVVFFFEQPAIIKGIIKMKI